MGTPTVYFIECAGKIKIGFTKNLPGRLAQFRTAHPDEITLIGAVHGSMFFERELHTRLAFHAVKGEWFQDCPEVRGVIASVLSRTTKVSRCPVADFLKEIETTTKATPPKTVYNNLTPTQLKLLGQALILRRRNHDLLQAAIGCDREALSEAQSILSLLVEQFKALVADCFYPNRGQTEAETLEYDRDLERRLDSHVRHAEFNLDRAKSALCVGSRETYSAVVSFEVAA